MKKYTLLWILTAALIGSCANHEKKDMVQQLKVQKGKSLQKASDAHELLKKHCYICHNPDAASQTTESLVGIRLNMSVIPGIFLVVSIVLLFFYKLDKKKMTEIEAELESRRAEEY